MIPFKNIVGILVPITLLLGAGVVSAQSESVPVRDPAWTFQTGGAIWSSPAVQGNTVYFGSDDGYLYAVEAGTGQLKWKVKTSDRVRVRPAIADGTVYFASDDGYLYALEAETGQEQWRLDIGNAAVQRLLPANDYNWDYLASSPAVADGMIYIGSADGFLYAVYAQTGQPAWRFQTGDRVRSSPAVAYGMVYVGSWDGLIYAVDAQSGQEKWRFDVSTQYRHVQPSPTIVDGVVYIGARNSPVCALDAQTGEQIWAFKYLHEWVESSAAVVDAEVYVGSSADSRLYVLDSATGELAWDFNTVGYAFCSPAVSDGVVYMGTVYSIDFMKAAFYAIDIQGAQHRKTTDAKWLVEVGPSLDTSPQKISGVVSSPAVADGTVYFGGLDGKLYAVSTAP
jgi:outer membrane protein assembly factor BamB